MNGGSRREERGNTDSWRKARLLQGLPYRETQNWTGLLGCVMVRWNRREIRVRAWDVVSRFHAFTHVYLPSRIKVSVVWTERKRKEAPSARRGHAGYLVSRQPWLTCFASIGSSERDRRPIGSGVFPGEAPEGDARPWENSLSRERAPTGKQQPRRGAPVATLWQPAADQRATTPGKDARNAASSLRSA